MTNDMERLECPICNFNVLPSDEYVLRLHFEQQHTEDSPFRIEDDPEPLPPPIPPRTSSKGSKQEDEDTPSDSEDENSVLCPEPDCGEVVLLSDFNDHLDLHSAATLSFDETTGKYYSHQPAKMPALDATTNSSGKSKDPSFIEQNFDAASSDTPRRHENGGRKLKRKAPRDRHGSSASEKSTLSRTILAFNPFAKSKIVKAPRNTARLGRAELGPHAWEDRMPKWLHNQLANGPKITIVNRIGRDGRLIKQEKVQNETPGIIPILAQLSALDRSVKAAYYCHPSTLHIGKTPREGGFCGYRNIQMLISYIQGARGQGHEEFPGRTPGILKLQDLIERAWDKGINDIGRQQTGGIRDTRKYIGTPEAQALFLSSEIDCAVELFTDSPDGQIEAHEQLLYAIESYFSQADAKNDGSNVYKTLLPPIYLQQPGHSTTIIGFERRKDGACNLMTFDPMYHTSPAMHSLIGRKHIKTPRPEVMQAYRRIGRQLRKHAAFEVLMLTAHPPLFPAWDVLRQFPDCRYVYAFFRSKTLGYDVYPEDHFLRNFPWQQYGGLWIIDDARFARAEKMSPLTVQALRRITGEGASAPSSLNASSGSLDNGLDHTMSQLSSALQGIRIAESSRLPSHMSSFDGSGLSLQIPQAFPRQNPGYPSPFSPTSVAKQLYSSPNSVDGRKITHQLATPVRACTLMSIDGSDMCGPSRRSISHGHEHYAKLATGRYDNFDAAPLDNGSPKRLNPTTNSYQPIEYVPEAKVGGVSLASPPRSISASSISPISPPRAMSPRTAMLKSMLGKQALSNMNHSPGPFPADANTSSASLLEFLNNKCTGLYASFDLGYPHSHPQLSAMPDSPPSDSTPPSIEIANGIETSTVSPISPTGTMLRYTSYRPVDSGLLAVRPLSEAQVAEYRFWRPCGRRACAFGCGEKDEGEVAAAKRLFRDEDIVREPEPELEEEDNDCIEGEQNSSETGKWGNGRGT